MAKSKHSPSSSQPGSGSGASFDAADWRSAFPSTLPNAAPDCQPQIQAVAQRFNREYQGQAVELPPEVEAMGVFQDWAAGSLQARIASPFWELLNPQKNQHGLDLGCGLSFLIYPWRDWGVFFHGQEISSVARDALQSRGPQLNSKLFKGVKLGPAHQLDYDLAFDWVVATGVSCYYPIEYWRSVLEAVRTVLKPGGYFAFDVLNPETELAENWAILETYLGADVELTPLSDWLALLKEVEAQVVSDRPGEIFTLYKIRWS